MPELPEVETVAADLRPALVGKRIVRCHLRFPTIVRYPEPEAFRDGVEGRTIEALTRRGKYLLHHLNDGYLMVVHLGMTGSLRVVDPGVPYADHVHAVLDLDDLTQLRYRDPRRFGRLLFGTEDELVARRALPRLGPEPIDLSFSALDLYRRLHHRRAPLKALLLDQAVVAGVGNIYADESCFRARIRPDRPANSLSRQAVRRLRDALQESLTTAIANRGSSVDSYRDAFGEKGRQQEELLVYGRAGEPCPTCGRPLASLRLAGRTTVFCRRCQR
ncbi:MAG TPA: bifunctional DNA-formamidopyrimidine glycosylase/DNA-(apurinic or apyrimidinic site) lyase [Candidatus Dormibacteraeota bacterium]